MKPGVPTSKNVDDPPENKADSQLETSDAVTSSGEKRRPKTERENGATPGSSVSIDARLVALAAAVEALSTGHARVIATELRRALEAACGAAEVVSIASRRTPR